MSTPKEIFLELIKPDGQPERMLCQYEPFYMCLGDPIMRYLDGDDHVPGKTSVNPWGVTISFPEGAPGSMPVHGPGLTVCPDITKWREVVHAPDLVANFSEGWEEFRQHCVADNNDRKMLTGFMATGIFEQCHFLMGFEDTLTALYEHPKEMHELIDYITEYRLLYAKMAGVVVSGIVTLRLLAEVHSLEKLINIKVVSRTELVRVKLVGIKRHILTLLSSPPQGRVCRSLSIQ